MFISFLFIAIYVSQRAHKKKNFWKKNILTQKLFKEKLFLELSFF